MRFVWPAQRYDRLTKGPAALATALTVLACVATAIPLVTLYRDATRPRRATNDEHRETVTFVHQQTRRVAANREAAETQLAPRAPRAGPAIRPSIVTDTGSPSPAKAQSTPATDTASAPATEAVTSKSRAIGPVMAPPGVGKVIIPEAAQDSINKRMAAFYLKRLQTFVLTPEQKDSIAQEQARRAEIAHDDHRPLAVPLGHFSIPLHRGGNKVRDSIINADYLQRLALLEERARAKRDSMLRASLAAKRDTDGRGDSLKRLLPIPDPRR